MLDFGCCKRDRFWLSLVCLVVVVVDVPIVVVIVECIHQPDIRTQILSVLSTTAVPPPFLSGARFEKCTQLFHRRAAAPPTTHAGPALQTTRSRIGV